MARLRHVKAEDTGKVQHDEDNGKFYIPYPDKQAVLRYTEDEEGVIHFQSIFVPPSLREDGLEQRIVTAAYEFAEENEIPTNPPSAEEFYTKNQDHV